jgi:hypothetical protein
MDIRFWSGSLERGDHSEDVGVDERIQGCGVLKTVSNQLTTSQWSRVLEKLTVTQLVKKFPAFFLEPEGSLQCSQQTPTGPCMHPVHIFTPNLSNIQSNIILPSTPGSSEWSLPVSFSDQIADISFVLVFLLCRQIVSYYRIMYLMRMKQAPPLEQKIIYLFVCLFID